MFIQTINLAYLFAKLHNNRINTPIPPFLTQLAGVLTYRRDFSKNFFVFGFSFDFLNFHLFCSVFHYLTIPLSNNPTIFAKKTIMDAISQQLLDSYTQNLLTILPTKYGISNESVVSDGMDDWLHLWKMDDISSLPSAQFKQQYQSRFTPAEFRRLYLQNSEVCMLCRWFTNDFFKEYFSRDFRRQVGIYVNDDFNGALSANLFEQDSRYNESRMPNILWGSTQTYFVFGNSDITISLIENHHPHIYIRDNSAFRIMASANNCGAFVELLENASVTIEAGSAPIVAVKHDSTVTINDLSGNAIVVNNPRDLMLLPLNVAAYKSYMGYD